MTAPLVVQYVLQPLRARRHQVLAVVGFLALGLLIYAPALGTGKFVYGTDTFSHDYLMHLYGWEQSIWGRGELPLWCPYLFCGFPFIGSAALCPFYPTQWLYAILPFNTSFTLQYALAVALAGFTFFWWMRQLQVRRAVAGWGGVAFAISGHFLTLTYAGHLQKMIAIAWAPVALGAMLRILGQAPYARRNPQFVKSTLLLMLAWAMQLLATHPQIFYATFGCCILHLAGDLVFRRRRAEEPDSTHARKRTVANSIGAVAAAAALAVALSAVQIFTTSETHVVSNRAAGVSYAEAVQTSYPPAELLEYVIPSVFGDTVRGTQVPYTGQWGERIVSDYVGLPTVVLAVFGVVLARRRYRWFLLGLLACSLIIGLGRFTPVYWLLFKVLPGFSTFRSPGTFMFVADLALVALACFGLEALLDRAKLQQFVGWASAFKKAPASEGAQVHDLFAKNAITAAAAVLLIVGVICALLGFDQVSGTKLEIATAQEKLHYLTYRDMLVGGLELALVTGLFVIARWMARPTVIILAAFALLLPAVHNRHFLQFDTLAPFLDYMKTQPTLNALSNSPQPIRLTEENKLKNDAMLSGIASSSGYHPVVLDSYTWAAENLGLDSEQFTGTFDVNYGRGFSGRAPAAGTWEAAGRFRKAGRLEYLWRRAPAASYFPATRVVPVTGNGAEQRRTYLASAKSQQLDQQHAADTGEQSASPPVQLLDLALMERARVDALRVAQGPQQVRGWIQSWSPDDIELRVSAAPVAGATRAIIRLAEFWAPGWKARLADGRRVPVVQVNGFQRALAVPAGESVLRMWYAPFGFRLGLFVTLGTLTLLLASGLGTATRRVRRAVKRTRGARKEMATTVESTATAEAASAVEAAPEEVVGPPGLEPGTNRL